MKSSFLLKLVTRAFSHFVSRFHVILYTLTIVAGVSIAVFMLNNLISISQNTDAVSTPSLTIAEEETMKRIDNFHISGSEQDNFSLPPGRVNPFVE